LYTIGCGKKRRLKRQLAKRKVETNCAAVETMVVVMVMAVVVVLVQTGIGIVQGGGPPVDKEIREAREAEKTMESYKKLQRKAGGALVSVALLSSAINLQVLFAISLGVAWGVNVQFNDVDMMHGLNDSNTCMTECGECQCSLAAQPLSFGEVPGAVFAARHVKDFMRVSFEKLYKFENKTTEYEGKAAEKISQLLSMFSF